MKSLRKTLTIVFGIIFIAVVLGLYAMLYLIPSVIDARTETYIVQADTIRETDEAHAIVVRDERVYTAPKSGNISYYAAETEKTRKNFTVADVYTGGNKTSMNCPSTGFISYYLDGYESYFLPDTLGDLRVEDYMDLDVTPENTVRSSVSSGDPVYKLITSNTWYIMLIVPQEKIKVYKVNQKLTITLNEEKSMDFTVVRLLGALDAEYRTVVASTKLFYEKFAQLRSLDVKIVTKETSGLLVPTSAIVNTPAVEATETQEAVPEKNGVYVLGIDDVYKYKEIEILLEDGDYTLVKQGQNLKLYDEVLRNASDRPN